MHGSPATAPPPMLSALREFLRPPVPMFDLTRMREADGADLAVHMPPLTPIEALRAEFRRELDSLQAEVRQLRGQLGVVTDDVAGLSAREAL